MTAEQIDAYLHKYFLDGYEYQLSNSFVFWWECDFFAIARSGYAYEVEVKVSRSDFFKDFDKTEKHRALSWQDDKYVQRTHIAPEVTEHVIKKLKGKKFYHPPRSHVKFVPIEDVRPNKFVYACPEGMIAPHEVPDYAGLMFIQRSTRRSISKKDCFYAKKPPTLHTQKADFTKRLLDKFYWYYRTNRDLPKTKAQIGIESQQ